MKKIIVLVVLLGVSGAVALSPDLYAGDGQEWVVSVLAGTGLAAWLAALVRALFALWGDE